MAAELFFGVVFNLSVWYKLTDRTIWGSILSLIGFAVMLTINVIFVPRISYYACAWGAFASYGVMMLVSYFVGQAKYPVDYCVRRLAAYTALAAVLYVAGIYGLDALALNAWAAGAVRAVLLTVFIAVAVRAENIPLGAAIAKIRR